MAGSCVYTEEKPSESTRGLSPFVIACVELGLMIRILRRAGTILTAPAGRGCYEQKSICYFLHDKKCGVEGRIITRYECVTTQVGRLQARLSPPT